MHEETTDPRKFVRRERTLTDADLLVLSELLKDHECRFSNVTREDMDFLKDLMSVYKETRSEIIKWVVKGMIYLCLLALVIFAYIRYGGKS